MRMNALIRSNIGVDPCGLTPMEYSEAFAQAIWLEKFRLRNTAEMLVAMFGGKKN